MKSNQIMQSKIYRFLDYVLRLILLNFLILIPSFSFLIVVSNIVKSGNNWLVYVSFVPVFLWLVPSIVATMDVIRQYETKQTNTIFKDFFKSIKKYYWKSLLLTGGIILFFLIFGNSIRFFYNQVLEGFLYIFGFILSCSFAIVLAMTMIHIALVMVYFDQLRMIEIIKLAFIMAFKDIIGSLLAIATIILIAGLDMTIYIVMFIGGFSIPIYLVVKLTFKKYIKIYRKIGEK
ncbi:MAG: DUF624 domain-containing protein [Anaeroplasma bactoclasticum]|nr:DUF624 domain-containing protein [Anaeroplasma bactoclasticum]